MAAGSEKSFPVEIQTSNPWHRAQHPWSNAPPRITEAKINNSTSLPTLADVMSEQLAVQLQEDETQPITRKCEVFCTQDAISPPKGLGTEQQFAHEMQGLEDETDSDFLLAQMLQYVNYYLLAPGVS